MHTSTLRTLLVPIDGSSLAEQAFAPAVRLAKSADASLHLVLVEPPVSIMAMEQQSSDGAPPSSGDELRLGYRQYLASMARTLSSANGVRTEWALLAGWAPHSLAVYIDEHDIDLTVMTTHGRSGFSRFWLGSVADELLHRVTSPVLLLRPSDTPPRFDSILVAVDESAVSEKALEVSVAVGLLREGSRITLGTGG